MTRRQGIRRNWFKRLNTPNHRLIAISMVLFLIIVPNSWAAQSSLFLRLKIKVLIAAAISWRNGSIPFPILQTPN